MIAMTTARDNGQGSVIAGYTFVPDNLETTRRKPPWNPLPAPLPSSRKPSFTNTTTDNRIQKAGDTQFTFDDNGNTETKGGKHIRLRRENNLTSVVGDFNATYEYDGLGHRRSRTVGGQTTRYVLDILGMSKVLMETDENGVPVHYYIYGLGLISRIALDDQTRYYCYDTGEAPLPWWMIRMKPLSPTNTGYDEFGVVIDLEEEDFNSFRYVGRFGVAYGNRRFVFYAGEVL